MAEEPFAPAKVLAPIREAEIQIRTVLDEMAGGVHRARLTVVLRCLEDARGELAKIAGEQ